MSVPCPGHQALAAAPATPTGVEAAVAVRRTVIKGTGVSPVNPRHPGEVVEGYAPSGLGLAPPGRSGQEKTRESACGLDGLPGAAKSHHTRRVRGAAAGGGV